MTATIEEFATVAEITAAVLKNCSVHEWNDAVSAAHENSFAWYADLRGSNLNGMQVGLREVRGAIIDSSQAIYVAELAGVVIRDHEQE